MMGWYAVRHVVQNGDAYEERITLWRAVNFDEAIARAREEATGYAAMDRTWRLLELFQAYRLSDAPSDGAEVFSLIRRADLEAPEYLERFFDTGQEIQERE